MKRLPILCLVLFVVIFAHGQAFVAPRWQRAGTETFGKVSFELYAKQGSWGFGQQFFGANFSNNIFYKIHVKGLLVAILVCGDTVFSNVDFVAEKYSTVTKVYPDDSTGVVRGWGSDITGLLGSADENKCLGNVVHVAGYSGQPTHNRIAGLGIHNLQLFAIQDDQSEIPLSFDGQLQPTTGKPDAQATAAQAPVANPQPPTITASKPAAVPTRTAPVTFTPVEQIQTQAYIDNAKNPNNDPIQQSQALSQAEINARKPGGSTPYQRQEIQQVRQDQAQANEQAVASGITDLGTSLDALFNQNRQDKVDYQRQAEETIRQGAISGNPDDMVTEGLTCSNAKNYAGAFDWYSKAAAMGDTRAMSYIGQLYYFGWGRPKDDSTAYRWLSRSLLSGGVYGVRSGFLYDFFKTADNCATKIRLLGLYSVADSIIDGDKEKAAVQMRGYVGDLNYLRMMEDMADVYISCGGDNAANRAIALGYYTKGVAFFNALSPEHQKVNKSEYKKIEKAIKKLNKVNQ